ncbi:nitroreductase/quinone reductase family protein [Agromyces binzhouensis]|uniref:nitroreductase/quinone reductase family protein n=1 Tax=Agromyces binzhouensis TaxID=1817495 RepID=UPI0036303AF1
MRVLGQVLVALLAVVTVAAAVAGTTIVIGFRRRDPRVLGRLVRWQRERVNPRVLETAGLAGDPHSVVRHVGRTTGRDYATPITAVPVDGGFEVVLPYGAEANWVRNVLAAGAAVLEHDGRRYEVVAPEVLPIRSTGFAERGAVTARVFGLTEALRLSTGDAAESAPPRS